MVNNAEGLQAKCVSSSRARRLRNSATKRKMYECLQKECDGSKDSASESRIEDLIPQVQHLVSAVQSLLAYCTPWADYTACAPWDAVLQELVPNQTHDGLWSPSKPMNPAAEIFFPASHMNGMEVTAQEAACTHDNGETSTDTNQDVCPRCGDASKSCICEEVYCRHCFKFLKECMCEAPLFKERLCNTCGEPEDSFSLFDGSLDYDAHKIAPEFHCPACGCSTFMYGELRAVQSAKCCQKCRRLGYQDLEWCQARSCESEGMFHTACMTRIEGSWFCDTCIASGRFDTGDNSSNEEVDDAAGILSQRSHDTEEHTEDDELDDEENISYGGMSARETPAVADERLWDEDGVLVWTQVSIRLFNGAADAEHGRQILRDRWRTAKKKIPPDKRERMQFMLEQRFEISLNE